MFAMFNVASSSGHGDCLCGAVCVRDWLTTSSSGLGRSWVCSRCMAEPRSSVLASLRVASIWTPIH